MNACFEAAAQPYGGFRYAVGRDIRKAEWPRVYDLICRLWDEVPLELRGAYEAGVNRILAAHSIAWDLGNDGRLHRVTPAAVQEQIAAAFSELRGEIRICTAFVSGCYERLRRSPAARPRYV